MKNIIVQPNITIRQAMKTLDKTAEKCLLVVNDNKKLLGTLTDGDLRRSILAGIKFSEDISECYHKRPVTLVEGHFKIEEAKQLLREKKLNIIPVIDDEGTFIEYL